MRDTLIARGCSFIAKSPLVGSTQLQVPVVPSFGWLVQHCIEICLPTMSVAETNGTIAASLQSGFEYQDNKYKFGLCDMAGKLMTAMSRVADEGFGDMRCLVREEPISATGGLLTHRQCGWYGLDTHRLGRQW